MGKSRGILKVGNALPAVRLEENSDKFVWAKQEILSTNGMKVM